MAGKSKARPRKSIVVDAAQQPASKGSNTTNSKAAGNGESEAEKNKNDAVGQSAAEKQVRIQNTAAGRKHDRQKDIVSDSIPAEVEAAVKSVDTEETNAAKKLTENVSSKSSSNEDGSGASGKGDKKNVGSKDNKSSKTKGGASQAKQNLSEPPAKKQKLTSAHTTAEVHVALPRNPGFVLVVGEGDTGQLGLGPDVMDRSKPGRVSLPADVIQVCAGGMHSVCLTKLGEVFTFGCNDEGALGRKVAEEDECMSPGKVELNEKIVLVSAGDSHTAALSNQGRVYIWGTFRDSNGPIGILPDHGKIETPLEIMKDHHTVKIASGCDHLVCLTREGEVYTLGAAEQGQLGRVPECFSQRGGRRGLGFLLTPALVSCKKRSVRFCNIWTGSYYTFAKDKDTGDIYAWGLNNYYQLGIADMQNRFIPEKCTSFDRSKNWTSISGGQHHTLALDGSGNVYSMGRKEYGRLGHGEEGLEEKSSPTLITKLQNQKCVDVNCGSAVSYAVSDDGTIFVWGMGSTKQLGQGDDNEEDVYEPLALTGKQLENKKGLMTSAGGQHTLFLAQDRS